MRTGGLILIGGGNSQPCLEHAHQLAPSAEHAPAFEVGVAGDLVLALILVDALQKVLELGRERVLLPGLLQVDLLADPVFEASRFLHGLERSENALVNLHGCSPPNQES